MITNHRLTVRLLSLLTALLLLVQPLCVLAEEQEEPITHIATSTVAKTNTCKTPIPP